MKQLLFAFLVILLDVMGCVGSNRYPELDVSPTTVELENKEGASGTINLSFQSEWHIEMSQGYEWLEVSPLSGSGDAKIAVRAKSSNESSSGRYAVLEIEGTYGPQSCKVEVIQRGKESSSN